VAPRSAPALCAHGPAVRCSPSVMIGDPVASNRCSVSRMARSSSGFDPRVVGAELAYGIDKRERPRNAADGLGWDLHRRNPAETSAAGRRCKLRVATAWKRL
jgi:hypothetical protein